MKVKKGYWTLLKLVVSISLIYYLLFIRYDASTIYHTFIDVQGKWVFLALGGMLLSNICGTLQWNLILKSLGIYLPMRRVAAFYFTGLFFNNFLLSFVGGDFVRIYDVTKSSGKNSAAISTVLLDRLIGFITLLSLAFLGFFYTLKTLNSTVLRFSIPGIFVVLVFILLFLFHKPFAKKFEAFGLKITPKRFQNHIREIYDLIHDYRNHPKLIGKLFIIAFVVQSARIIVHFMLARSIGVSANIFYFFLFIPVITILISFPVTFGGIGVREGSASALFSRFTSVSGEEAFLFELLAYIVAIICSLPGGIAFVFRKHELQQK